MTPADHYLDTITDVYERGTDEQLTARLARWFGTADVPVLLFHVLRELRELRAELATRRGEGA